MSIDSVVLSEDQQLELSRIDQSRSLPAGYVFRARLIVMLAGGSVVQYDQAEVGYHSADDQPVETAIPCCRD
jgi:hypothetical protein